MKLTPEDRSDSNKLCMNSKKRVRRSCRSCKSRPVISTSVRVEEDRGEDCLHNSDAADHVGIVQCSRTVESPC